MSDNPRNAANSIPGSSPEMRSRALELAQEMIEALKPGERLTGKRLMDNHDEWRKLNEDE